MSFTGLLNQPLTIQRRSSTTTDEYGNEVPGTTGSVQTLGYVQQTQATEITVDRETYVSNWLVMLPAGTEIDASDRIIYGSTTFEVIGPPHHWWNPRTKRTHRVECSCRAVTG